MLRRLGLAAIVALLPSLAAAQDRDPMALIAPTAPLADFGVRIANTKWVHDYVGAIAASLPVFVDDPAYGCVGNGIANDTACISAAVTAAAGVRDVLLSGKTYCIDPIKFGDGGLPVPPAFGGVGGSISTLKACGVSASPTLTYSKFDRTQTAGLHDLFVDANSKHANALLVHGCQYCTFDRILVGNATSDNFVVHGEPSYNVQYSSFRDITSRGSGRHSFRFYSDNNAGSYFVAANFYSSLRAGQNSGISGGDCFNIDYATVDVISGEAESCGGYGINLNNTKGGTWVGVHVEGNGLGGINGVPGNTHNMRFLGGRMSDTVASMFLTEPSHYVDSVDITDARLNWLGSISALSATFGGGVSIGSPTGGLEGVGTLNLAGGLYNNGVAPIGSGGYVRGLASAALPGAIPAWPNNLTTFFRGDGTYANLNINAISGWGSGVAAAAGNSVNATGGFVTFSGALGTPTSGVGTNLTGTANGLTAGAATVASTVAMLDDTSTNATVYPSWFSTTSGSLVPKISSTKLTFNPFTGIVSATGFAGSAAGLTGLPLTTGVTGQLPLANGGTAANLTPSNGGILYSGASALAILAGTATARLPLLSGASTVPVWGAYSIPSSVTSGGVPYFSSTTAQASSGTLVTNGVVYGGGFGGAPATAAAGTNGQVFLGVTSGAPQFATMSQDCTISNAGIITCTKTNNVAFTSYATAAVGQLPGETSTGSATASNIGEVIEASVVSGSAVSLTSTTAANVTSIALTAGDWEISGVVNFKPGGGTTVTTLTQGSISTTTNTVDATPGRDSMMLFNGVQSTTGYISQVIPPTRVSLSGTTTHYLVANATFTTSTLSAFGKIHARRAR